MASPNRKFGHRSRFSRRLRAKCLRIRVERKSENHQHLRTGLFVAADSFKRRWKWKNKKSVSWCSHTLPEEPRAGTTRGLLPVQGYFDAKIALKDRVVTT